MDDPTNNVASPWRPDTDLMHLALLGKLAEEANELGAILARCIIQGINEREPVTGKPNAVALENEMGDVLAGIRLATSRLGLNESRIAERAAAKQVYLSGWHKQIDHMQFTDELDPL